MTLIALQVQARVAELPEMIVPQARKGNLDFVIYLVLAFLY